MNTISFLLLFPLGVATLPLQGRSETHQSNETRYQVFVLDQCGGNRTCMVSSPWSVCKELGGFTYGQGGRFCGIWSNTTIQVFDQCYSEKDSNCIVRSPWAFCSNQNGSAWGNGRFCAVRSGVALRPTEPVISVLDMCGGDSKCVTHSNWSVCEHFNGTKFSSDVRYCAVKGLPVRTIDQCGYPGRQCSFIPGFPDCAAVGGVVYDRFCYVQDKQEEDNDCDDDDDDDDDSSDQAVLIVAVSMGVLAGVLLIALTWTCCALRKRSNSEYKSLTG